jgi:hypothetical protein
MICRLGGMNQFIPLFFCAQKNRHFKQKMGIYPNHIKLTMN